MVASLTRHSEVNQLAELNPKHERELVQKRGLKSDWVAVNCKSIDTRTATEHLGYKAYSDGILLSGNGYQEQFKPDDAWASQDGKKPKYRSCKDEDGYDAMLPAHPDKKRFWDDLEALKDECYQIDGYPCLVVTEGFFKAISLTSHGVPTICLLGVEMGLTSAKSDPQGKRYLVPGLERLARAGFGFIIAFDADCARKNGVKTAQENLAHRLSQFGVPVYSITGLWEEAEGKGIDDYIQMNGFEEFRDKVLARSLTIEQWREKYSPGLERQLSQDSKTPTQVSIAREIAEEYENKLAFNCEAKIWMRYEAQDKGIWSPEDDLYIESIISQLLTGKGIKFRTHTYVKQVVEALRVDPKIIKRKWLERTPGEVLPHHNGVLEIATGKFVEHSPLNYLTWILPREYNPLAQNWSKINAWLDEASQGNPVIKNLLICFANAVLKGRSDIQKMLHLTGLGGSGKTTYSNLVTDIIGENNILDEGVEQFCTNHFTPIRAYQKRLVLFSDEQDLPKNISNIMKLVGGNNLTGEQKHKPAFQFRFTGMAMLVSEHPIAQGVKGNGWKRRIIPIPMNAKVADRDRRDLRAEFKPELAAFTNYLLSLDDNFVTQVLRGVGDIPECQLQFWQSRLREDSLAAWLNDCVISDASATTPIGDGQKTGTLYSSYREYCQQSGLSAKSLPRFSPELLEVCQSVLGLEVQRIRTRVGTSVSGPVTCISGIRLRTEGTDDAILTHEQDLTKSVRVQKKQSVSNLGLPETPTTQGRAGCAGLNQHLPNSTPTEKKLPDSPLPEKPIVEVSQSIQSEPQPKPAIAKYTLDQKKKWLKKTVKEDLNKDVKSIVWLEHPSYTGEATLLGRSYLDDVPWKVKHPNGELNVKPENIEIFEALCGDIQPIPDKPKHTQPELLLEPQTETPIQRVKRLAKQQKIKLTANDQTFSQILSLFEKSAIEELTDEELTRIADKWEEQIESAKRKQENNRITKYLEE
ncbi:phage/plasmid primase, P4 family [Limnoraphis robusta]|uniref:phage/plasmid primase, P4 family n=4 Tax=Limnoraphis robusta TaxID=1118279 RepID=UPI002B1EB04C|nr:phage/plasmid primase, P4 family [Limnoraphis robusta]MEA5496399.1 phage/plasmid primase, P4 family [Limnoraphis robusta BA-68 BA1]